MPFTASTSVSFTFTACAPSARRCTLWRRAQRHANHVAVVGTAQALGPGLVGTLCCARTRGARGARERMG